MIRHITLPLAALAVAATLGLSVGSAAARSLSVNTEQIRAAWSSLELSNTVTSGVVRCPVTLEGSFASATVAKRAELTIGRITRANVAQGACINGSATIHSETLPWTISYQGFFGSLPRISGIKLSLIGVFFEIESEGNTCSARSEEDEPINGILELNGATGENTGIRAEETARITLTNGRGGILCRLSKGIFRGDSNTVVQPAPAIQVTLI